jgi:hypothetical protein
VLYLVLLVVVHLGLAVFGLLPLFFEPERQREGWAGAVLLLASVTLGLAIATDRLPTSLWKLIEAIFSPIGTPLFKPTPP